MLYKRITYRIEPNQVSQYARFLNDHFIPIQIKSGAKLIGQWQNESNKEMISIWEYPNLDEYLKIEKRVQKEKQKLEGFQELNLDCDEEFLSSTGTYESPKHTVSVSGFITNQNQETLLVKTYWRSDTWELPGGGVDEGETLDKALCREIFEETGVQVSIHGVTGVYSNGSVVTIVFLGEYVGGRLTTSSETKEVAFVKLDESNFDEYIKRPKFKPRVLDALKGDYVPYEAFKVRPYELLARYEGD
ncbi:NUDIX domain-containing protein [Bacillus sp. JJ1521]|uniref:NUDIX domain-containing protein n=1 Tax=Bacillus sp. JJ1521 TaxID=3122957 RepID=UPI002FFFB248